MKTFNTFKEDLKQSLSPLKQFGQKFSKDANVFVISHKADLHDKFNSVIRFEKVKGFSRVVY